MTKYYSPSTGGFFSEEIHGIKNKAGSLVPDDAVEISEEKHSELLEAQSSGKEIHPDADGRPVAVKPRPSAPTVDGVKARAKALLADCDWTQLADVDEETRSAFAPYRALLRGILTQTTDPAAVIWPEPPTI
jgi:hypothetical protein